MSRYGMNPYSRKPWRNFTVRLTYADASTANVTVRAIGKIDAEWRAKRDHSRAVAVEVIADERDLIKK